MTTGYVKKSSTSIVRQSSPELSRRNRDSVRMLPYKSLDPFVASLSNHEWNSFLRFLIASLISR